MHNLHTLPRKRRRTNRTNYTKRLKLLKSGKTRLVVRKTNTRLVVQLVDYDPDGDKVIATATSSELKEFGWKGSLKNIPAAYLTGVLIAAKAKKAKVKEAILDIGLHTPSKGGKVFAVAKGAHDAGLNVPVSDSIAPSEERIFGEHVKVSKKDIEDVKSKIKV